MIADGMGGTGNGGFASQTVAEQMRDWWDRKLPELLEKLEKSEIHAYVSQSLNQNILQWNHMIYQQSKRLSISTGTTLSLLFAYQNQAVLKQIGDSRIYLERDGEWIQLTTDQTWEQREIAKGKNPLLDKDFYKKKGALTNALGTAKRFFLGILLWRIGAIRAGDAKFMWTVGVLKGWRHFLFSMVYSILAGGVIGIFIVLVKRDGKRRIKRLRRYLETIFLQKRIFQYEAEEPGEFPFSVPLAVGCLLEYFYPILGSFAFSISS